jgi:hypothetical protein
VSVRKCINISWLATGRSAPLGTLPFSCLFGATRSFDFTVLIKRAAGGGQAAHALQRFDRGDALSARAWSTNRVGSAATRRIS